MLLQWRLTSSCETFTGNFLTPPFRIHLAWKYRPTTLRAHAAIISVQMAMAFQSSTIGKAAQLSQGSTLIRAMAWNPGNVTRRSRGPSAWSSWNQLNLSVSAITPEQTVHFFGKDQRGLSNRRGTGKRCTHQNCRHYQTVLESMCMVDRANARPLWQPWIAFGLIVVLNQYPQIWRY